MVLKKQLLYLRPAKTVPANTEDYKLLFWNPTRYDTRDRLAKVQITHIGNTIANDITYRLEYGESWVFDYQIASTSALLPLSAPLDVDDTIEVFVTNSGSLPFDAEIVLMGTYETILLKELTKP